jgi:CDP-diacylglycerol---serine O-phosphatidyltransferase
LPSPAAAAIVMGFVWLMHTEGFQGGREGPWLAWSAFAITLFAGLTMVTNVPFYSFKDVSFRRSVPFVFIVAIALGIALINIHPPAAVFGLFLIYGLSGYGTYVWRRMKGRPVSVIATSIDEPDERGLHR